MIARNQAITASDTILNIVTELGIIEALKSDFVPCKVIDNETGEVVRLGFQDSTNANLIRCTDNEDVINAWCAIETIDELLRKHRDAQG